RSARSLSPSERKIAADHRDPHFAGMLLRQHWSTIAPDVHAAQLLDPAMRPQIERHDDERRTGHRLDRQYDDETRGHPRRHSRTNSFFHDSSSPIAFCSLFARTKFSSTSTSMLVRMKQRNASSGVQTMGSARQLNDVFTMTGQPVRR